MRALVVKHLNEGIELGLLLKEVGTGRPRSVHLQSSMHAFMTPVLLRMSRLDTLDGNAEAKPPNG